MSDETDAVHMIESEAGCLEVMEARGVLEPPVAALVAQKATADVLKRLEGFIREMREHAAQDDFDAYFEADKGFHVALADAASNALVTSALAPLLETMDQRVYREFTRHYYLKNVDDLQQVVDLHHEILEAIEKNDDATAFAKTVEHWDRMREIWEA
jgi:GntR family transcriptional repressor for pyruvate dehydrogenase complex